MKTLTVISQDYMGFTTGAPGNGEAYAVNTPTRLTLSGDRAKVIAFRVTRQEGFGATFTIQAGGSTILVIGGTVPDDVVGELFEVLVRGFRVEDVTVTATQRSGLLVTLLGEV